MTDSNGMLTRGSNWQHLPNPREHHHRNVQSRQLRGDAILDQLAGWISRFVGSMWTFVAVTTFIVLWLFAGNVVGFDRTPWPLLLTIVNLPQLSIMISLQVSANLAQKTADARAEADHETLVALHAMSRQQLEILEGQNEILDLLRRRTDAAAAAGAVALTKEPQP